MLRQRVKLLLSDSSVLAKAPVRKLLNHMISVLGREETNLPCWNLTAKLKTKNNPESNLKWPFVRLAADDDFEGAAAFETEGDDELGADSEVCMTVFTFASFSEEDDFAAGAGVCFEVDGDDSVEAVCADAVFPAAEDEACAELLFVSGVSGCISTTPLRTGCGGTTSAYEGAVVRVPAGAVVSVTVASR